MKAHIRVDAESCIVHIVGGKAGNKSDVTQAHALLNHDEFAALGDTAINAGEFLAGALVSMDVMSGLRCVSLIADQLRIGSIQLSILVPRAVSDTAVRTVSSASSKPA